MKERKYVKLRVDMNEDIKLKIIDKMEQRDLIYYIWIRVMALAAKVNLQGELYMSKNIPYTIDTLAIEFNREPMQVEKALKVFMDLEMIEVTCGKIYKVKNFAKHKNIKVAEKPEIKNNENELSQKSKDRETSAESNTASDLINN